MAIDTRHVMLREAWATVVPDPRDRHGPLPPVMLAMTVVTGLVDAFSFLGLGHVFVANMTGNVIFSGFALAGASGFVPAASLAALAAFATGAFLGGRTAHRFRGHRGRVLHQALVLETVLVVAAFVVAAVADPAHPVPRFVLIALLGVALGGQNATARALAVPDLTTTVLTLTITGMASDNRAAGGRGARSGRRLLSVACLFAGGVGGAEAVLHGYAALPLLLAAVLLATVTLISFRLNRSQAGWTAPL
ncbi:DUF1275 domain-containing protein [Streptomyces sp. J2-1]|uniref:YoaK family protein n=1 Tax=Streptomyces corallincola TaxID=2851888 RepID=UPI001C391CA2|nr:YoaK family protein [Streptomyces corallincola]MBV2353958.1 DUF1275 domain-containing protein [Streptomyces corallincola]